jgi:hypothetical protein
VRVRIGIILLFLAGFLAAEEGASLRTVPVLGLPSGSVRSYALLQGQTGEQLVIESAGADGTVGFYILDPVNDTLRARPIGAAGLPAAFSEPPRDVPQSRTVSTGGSGRTARYWQVGQGDSPIPNAQLVEFVPLAERTFADLDDAVHAELPPEAAGIGVGYLVLAGDDSLRTRCVLEPNLMRPRERMTAVSAQWIVARGRAHLLVGFAVDAGADPWPVFYRLYSESMEVVYQTPVVHHTNPNRPDQPLRADLDGNGEDEIIILAGYRAGDAPGEGTAVTVLTPGSGTSARFLALNDCAARMNGDDVIALQRELARRGYDLGPYGIDGWYGPDTRAAVIRFQRAEGVLVTGVVDEATRAALQLR